MWTSNQHKIDQKENRRDKCLDLLNRIINEQDFFRHMITGVPKNKRQSEVWYNAISPQLPKAEKN